jgi:MYXO-CTERM domain-containing protein
MMKSIIASAAVVALAGAANAQVVVSEVLGSTGGTDWEFIELANIGGSSVDISGWTIELWDSDDTASFGGADAASPYVVPASTTLGAGDVFTFGNGQAASNYGPGLFDASLPSNAIENSSYTLILTDALSNPIESIFVTDGDPGDQANRSGTPITPDLTFGPDGPFLPAGFYRDANLDPQLLNFSTPGFGDSPDDELNNGQLNGGTPGFNQIPTPGAAALLAVAGLAGVRRRR